MIILVFLSNNLSHFLPTCYIKNFCLAHNTRLKTERYFFVTCLQITYLFLKKDFADADFATGGDRPIFGLQRSRFFPTAVQ